MAGRAYRRSRRGLWLLAVDAVLNVTTGLFDLSAHRWWLLSAAITVSIITGVSVALTRARDHQHATTSTVPASVTFTATEGGRIDLGDRNQIGDNNQQFNLCVQQQQPPLPPAGSVLPPEGVHNLPVPSAVFVGRDLDEVAETLDSGGGVIGQAVHGLGGVGKTELAVRVAREQAHSAYPRVPSPPSKPRDDEVDGTHEQNREHQPQNDSLQDPEEPRELLFCGAGRVKSGSLATDRAVKVTSEHSVPVAAEVEE